MKNIIFTLLLAFAPMSYGQSIKVATGSSAGTYSRVLKESIEYCKNSVQITESPSSGSMQNIDMILQNSTNAGFVQTDVLFFRSRTEDLSSVKTLVAFHPEQVHIVAKAQSDLKEGGTLGIGAKQVVLNTVNDLAGRTVVAAGGSYITGQVIRLQAEIQYNLLEVGTADEALKKVADGSAQAAILVGGAPLGNVAALDKQFKLLSVPEATMGKLKNVYKPARLNYSKMGAAGVPTVLTDAVLVSREYKSPKMVESLSKLRECILTNATELAETSGNHPAWQHVDVANKGKWPWYELPSKTPVKK